MLKFFRNIRRQLLGESNARTYLLYAIGEILLVVIGILIALQINNWNENRKAYHIENQYLNRLVMDFIADTVYLNRRIRIANVCIVDNKKYVYKAYKTIKNMEEYQALMKLLHWDSEHLVLQNSTYQELSNSGQLNLIDDSDLKEKIIAYYRDYEIFATHIKEFNEFSAGQFARISHIYNKYGAFGANVYDQDFMFRDSDWAYINDPSSLEFRMMEDTATIYREKHVVFLKYFEDLYKRAVNLIQLINVELELRN